MDSKRQQHQQSKGRGPRLERRNAAKDIDYEAPASTFSADIDSPALGLRATRSLELYPFPYSYSNQTSFRIGGSVEGEVDLLCHSLGLSGPDDFAIPITAWEAIKARSSSDLLPRSRLFFYSDDTRASATQEQHSTLSPTSSSSSSAPADSLPPPPPPPPPPPLGEDPRSDQISDDNDWTLARRDLDVEEVDGSNSPRKPSKDEAKCAEDEAESIIKSPIPYPRTKAGGDGGIKGVRPPPVLAPLLPISTLPPPPARCPPVLAPPPLMSPPFLDDVSSTWDILRSFAPEGEECSGLRKSFDKDEEEEEWGGVLAGGLGEGEELRELRLDGSFEGFTGTSSLSTMNDDDASSTSTETMFIISPNGRFKRRIKSWMRGVLLGSGSFGMVYEGISE
ncbi:Mitogen-activated protein kinase kinase kinase 1 [Ananas comosus]|uniref:Mitogen-activated protein kinase kinase kinase 1 n=1 Tax=Ananas comosus TaxID=4615 RepID=A0A199W332_ANACO|nr:Mitogen-activated protein kinase kinase kinase 1 [Ananas comosus]